jgi:hypothetical protein
MQGSVRDESRTISRVLRRFGQITGGAVLTTVAVAGVLPLLPMVAPVAGVSIPSGFLTGALMGWAQNIGTGAVGNWIVGAAIRAKKGESQTPDPQKEDWIFAESEKLLKQMLDGDIQLTAGISKIIRDNKLLEVYEESLKQIPLDALGIEDQKDC